MLRLLTPRCQTCGFIGISCDTPTMTSRSVAAAMPCDRHPDGRVESSTIVKPMLGSSRASSHHVLRSIEIGRTCQETMKVLASRHCPSLSAGQVFPNFSLVSVKRFAEAMEIDVDSEQGCG